MEEKKGNIRENTREEAAVDLHRLGMDDVDIANEVMTKDP